MADIFIAGIGRQPPKKFDLQLKESEKQLLNLRKFGTTMSNYQTVEYRSLHTIKLSNNQLFLTLKSDIERFNQEVREAIEKKAELPTYPWKYILYSGLRNLLRVVCDTQDPVMQQVFLKQASEWFYDQLQKKSGSGNSRPGTSAQPRPDTSQKLGNSLMVQSPEPRPTTSQKMNLTQRPDTSTRPPTSYDQMMPSEFKATVFGDYETGSRTKYAFSDPPYDRVNNYERRLPNQLAKPFSSHSSMGGTMTTRPGTSPNFFSDEFRRSTSGFRNHDPAYNPATVRQFPMFALEQKVSPQKVGQQGGGEEGEAQPLEPRGENKEDEKAEGEGEGEGEAEGEEEEAKVYNTEKKMYVNDQMTGYVQMVRDQLVPAGDRSNYAFYAPNGEVHELMAEQRWREAQHKQVIKKREREEIIGMIDEWAHAKSRVEDESIRRGEAMRYGSQFENRGFSPRPRTTPKEVFKPEFKDFASRPSTTLTGSQRVVPGVGIEIEKDWPPKNLNLESDEEEEEGEKDEKESVPKGDVVTIYREKKRPGTEHVRLSNIFDYSSSPMINFKTGGWFANASPSIEQQMNKMKVSHVREMHGDFIRSRQSVTPTEGKQRPSSMSVFTRGQSVKGMKRAKPLSLIMKSMTAASFKQAQFNEMDQVKKKLAKSQILVSMKTLSRALLIPEPVPKEELLPLPLMGSRLMINPFAVEKKKKGRRA